MKENLLVVESMIKQDVYTHKKVANKIAHNYALRRGNNAFLVIKFQSSHRCAFDWYSDPVSPCHRYKFDVERLCTPNIKYKCFLPSF